MISTKEAMWNLIKSKNKALDGDKVTVSASQIERMVGIVWDTAQRANRSDSLFNGLFGK